MLGVVPPDTATTQEPVSAIHALVYVINLSATAFATSSPVENE